MTHLFTPLTLRKLTIPNRAFVSPMCQYSSIDGAPTDWHLVHLGSRAVGGFGLVMQEATGVTAQGRISPGDAGIWNDTQVAGYKRITDFIGAQGAIPGIQLAHAGRKGSTQRPWEGHDGIPQDKGGWEVIGPSSIQFSDTYPMPRAMTLDDIAQLVADFRAAAKRSLQAGYKVIELHAAHGYLLHEFLSPLSNKRTDGYGGSRENRMRLVLEVAEALRAEWPQDWPMFVRISASEWVADGWGIADSVILCRELKQLGIDLIDVSSGGNLEKVSIPNAPGYQTPFAERIRREVEMPVGAVGLITDPAQAEHILATGQADAVLLARQALRDPYWALHAARALKHDAEWPVQYGRAG